MTSNVNITCENYFDDVKLRADKIKTKIKEFEAQKENIAAMIKGKGPKLVEAISSGDDNAVKRIQDEIASLKANLATVDAQIELLLNSPVAGNEELYELANDESEKLSEFLKSYESSRKELVKFADAQQTYWKKVYESMSSGTYAYVYAFEKMENHHASGGKCVKLDIEKKQSEENATYIVLKD